MRHGMQHPARALDRPRKSEAGTSIVEVMIAITVIAVGALTALSTLTGASALDEDIKERSVALRAALSKMESIAAYDYSDQITNLTTHWTTSPNSTFAVEGLAAAGGGAAQGTIAFDTTDALRIRATVTVNWVTRNGAPRALSLPRTFTEVIH
jgi:Tfp pilus assembly protein PilV